MVSIIKIVISLLACHCAAARQESWLILYGDVHVGTIGLRSGNPFDTDQWRWCCGFYPGSEPGECENGMAASFEAARS